MARKAGITGNKGSGCRNSPRPRPSVPLTVDPRESDANHVRAYRRTSRFASLRIINRGFIELISVRMEATRRPGNMQMSEGKAGFTELLGRSDVALSYRLIYLSWRLFHERDPRSFRRIARNPRFMSPRTLVAALAMLLLASVSNALLVPATTRLYSGRCVQRFY